MGKLDYFDVLLDRPNGVYFGGEGVSGRVNIKCNEAFKINSVKLEAKGLAYVNWSEHQGSGNDRRTLHYTSEENYLDITIKFAYKTGNNDLYLPVGEHSYPFNIILPPNLPTSFEHNIGYIRYYLYATVDIPWAIDKHARRTLTVLRHMDLNLDRALRMPYGASETKMICCGPCKNGPIVGRFSIPKTGYVSGEVIFFEASIDNQSSKEVKNLTVRLVQIIKFWASGKIRWESRDLAKVYCSETINPNSNGKWEDRNSKFLTIPPVCASTDGTCAVIKVSYELRLSFGASGMSMNRDVIIPIKIGTIPIQGPNGPPNAPPPFDEKAPLVPPPMPSGPSPSGESWSPSDPPPYDSLSFAPSQFDNSPIDAPFNQYKGEMYNAGDIGFRPNYIYMPNAVHSSTVTQYHG